MRPSMVSPTYPTYFADMAHFDRPYIVDLLTCQAHLSHTILFASDLMKLSTARPSMPTRLRARSEQHIASGHSCATASTTHRLSPRQARSPTRLELLSFNAPLFVEQYDDALHPYEVAAMHGDLWCISKLNDKTMSFLTVRR